MTKRQLRSRQNNNEGSFQEIYPGIACPFVSACAAINKHMNSQAEQLYCGEWKWEWMATANTMQFAPVARTVVVVDQYAFAGDISSSGRSPVFVGGRGSGAVGGGGRSRWRWQGEVGESEEALNLTKSIIPVAIVELWCRCPSFQHTNQPPPPRLFYPSIGFWPDWLWVGLRQSLTRFG